MILVKDSTGTIYKLFLVQQRHLTHLVMFKTSIPGRNLAFAFVLMASMCSLGNSRHADEKPHGRREKTTEIMHIRRTLLSVFCEEKNGHRFGNFEKFEN